MLQYFVAIVLYILYVYIGNGLLESLKGTYCCLTIKASKAERGVYTLKGLL